MLICLDMGLVLFVFLVFPKVFTKPNKYSEKPRILKKTKETQKPLGTTKKNIVFKGFSLTLGYGFCLVCFFLFPRKTRNTKENQKYKRKPEIQKKTKKEKRNTKENQKYKRKPEIQTKPENIKENQKYKRKPEIQKKTRNQKNHRENQKYKRKPKKTKQALGKTQKKTKFLKVSDPPLDMGLFFVFLVIPKVFTKQNSFRENQKYKRKPKKTKKALGKTQKKQSF